MSLNGLGEGRDNAFLNRCSYDTACPPNLWFMTTSAPPLTRCFDAHFAHENPTPLVDGLLPPI